LLEDEIEWRAQKQLALRMRRATLNTTKTLGGFDWHFNFLTACDSVQDRVKGLELGTDDYRFLADKIHVLYVILHERPKLSSTESRAVIYSVMDGSHLSPARRCLLQTVSGRHHQRLTSECQR
jgi:hypothetical protein